MEGTLGAAERIPFREGAREAALGGLVKNLARGLLGAGVSIPSPKRARDRRCLSRSGWGRALTHREQSRREQRALD
jgi:hypothetical protein